VSRARAAIQQCLAFGRLRDAWDLINAQGVQRTKELLQLVARRAQELLEVDYALRAYRELGDVASGIASPGAPVGWCSQITFAPCPCGCGCVH